MTIIDQLEAHPRIDRARMVAMEGQPYTRFRIVVSGEGWPDRMVSWPEVSDELLADHPDWLADLFVRMADNAAERKLADRAEGITAEQGYAHCDLCGREFGSDGYCDCVSKTLGLAK